MVTPDPHHFSPFIDCIDVCLALSSMSLSLCGCITNIKAVFCNLKLPDGFTQTNNKKNRAFIFGANLSSPAMSRR
jgi:hypothetical protein